MSAADATRPRPGPFRRFLKRLRRTRSADRLRENLEDVLDESFDDAEAGFSVEERHLLRNLLGFRHVLVEDVMVPRADIKALEYDIPSSDLPAKFVACGHVCMPIFRRSLDDPVGVLHLRDVVRALRRTGDENRFAVRSVKPFIKNVLFVPPSMPASDLLLKMRARRNRMALVIDEYGGTDGLVTIDDLIGRIVGDVEDDHDDVGMKPLYVDRDGAWSAAGRLPLSALEAELDVDVSAQEKFQDVDTLGGMVVTIAGRVPERGEIVTYALAGGKTLEFVIRDGDPRRIKRIGVKLIDDAPPHDVDSSAD